MSKITLNNVVSLIDATTAANTINANNATVQTAMDNTLSRDGTAPNKMGSNLDMNSFQVINLPAPATQNSPIRIKDLAGSATFSPLPVGGTSNQLLAKTSNADYAAGWTNSIGAATATSINNVAITAPATAATLTLANNITVTGPATSDTLIGKATTDVLTNKTFNTAGAGNVLQVNGVTVAPGQYLGEPSVGNATAGNIGEFVSAAVLIGSAVSLTSATPVNV